MTETSQATAERSPSQLEESIGLRWTGHPLVDMGIATLVAMAERGQPEEVTRDDLEEFARYAEEALQAASLRSHASVLFTVNMPYLQPSFKVDRQMENARVLLRAFAIPPEDSAPPCGYCGRPSIRAVHVRVATDRAYRTLVPLLTGEGVVNFAPYGQHGLPLCGLCITALQALVIGAPSCEGRALVMASDDPSLVVQLIAAWLPALRARVQLSRAAGAKVDTWKAPKTRLIERLIAVAQQQRRLEHPASITLYHASNSGQGPTIHIHYLSMPVVSFVQRAQTPRYHLAWSWLAQRSWRDAKRKLVDRAPTAEESPTWRNRLYEDLFVLPAGAATFVRRYFLAPQREALKNTQAAGHTPMWNLTQLFLKEVVGMDDRRIDVLRSLGDALADEIISTNDRGLFRKLFQATRYYTSRRLLLQVSSRRLGRGQQPILNFDQFLTAFEVAEELPQADWRFAWDLVLIRLIDQLHARDWIRQHREAAEELAAEVEASLSEVKEELPTATALG